MAGSLNKLTNMTTQGHLNKFSTLMNSVHCFGGGTEIHGTAVQRYPTASALKLPDNYQDINASEVGQFSPLRSRDISGSYMTSSTRKLPINPNIIKVNAAVSSDPHIEQYDCRGVVNLSSSMQSNVPSPYNGQHSILGMPGGQWGQGYKYLSDYLQNSHYLNLRNSCSRAVHSLASNKGIIRCYYTLIANSNKTSIRQMHNDNIRTKVDEKVSTTQKPTNEITLEETTENIIHKTPSRAEQLKRAVAAYGSTVIVFHVAISLASLGGFYLLVSSGLDVVSFIDYLGLSDAVISKKVSANAGTFVVAYAIHKVFAPVRIGITLTATPFIVKHLRKIGVLKPPVKV